MDSVVSECSRTEVHPNASPTDEGLLAGVAAAVQGAQRGHGQLVKLSLVGAQDFEHLARLGVHEQLLIKTFATYHGVGHVGAVGAWQIAGGHSFSPHDGVVVVVLLRVADAELDLEHVRDDPDQQLRLDVVEVAGQKAVGLADLALFGIGGDDRIAQPVGETVFALKQQSMVVGDRVDLIQRHQGTRVDVVVQRVGVVRGRRGLRLGRGLLGGDQTGGDRRDRADWCDGLRGGRR